MGGGLRRSDEVADFYLIIFRNIGLQIFHLISRSRDSVSLRLGHVAALTVHRTVIHYRADTSLPSKGSLGRFLQIALTALQGTPKYNHHFKCSLIIPSRYSVPDSRSYPPLSTNIASSACLSGAISLWLS